jgi:hypothetical protein
MKTEVRDLWSAALRSDEYKQGKNTLTRIVDGEEEHCCLGVLCKLYAQTHDLRIKTYVTSNSTRVLYGEDEAFSYLPDEVIEWSGIARQAEYVLSDLNDDDPGKTFPEIADWIDENL